VPNEESMVPVALKDRLFKDLMKASAKGAMIAYQKQELPFVSISLHEKSAWCMGQFLQMKMIEILYVGYLFGINPFDQPQVELYKQEMRKLLNYE
jgi:glucose-6-phosphate isomerase